MIEKKAVSIELEWALLEDIARYYKFPTAVFLLSRNSFEGSKKGALTRDQTVAKNSEAYHAIKDIVFDREKEGA